MILIKLLFLMFFVFPLVVMILGAYAFLKLRSQLFKPFAKTSFNDLHMHAPPQRGDMDDNIIEGEYTVMEEKERP